MPATRSGRSGAAALLVFAVTAGLAGGGRLLTPSFEPHAQDYRRQGPADAKVVIAEFSDFQCPSCAAAAPHVKSIRDLYPDKVAVVFMHNPWDFHPLSRTAAVAAECAGKAGRFWDFHDRLFAEQSAWEVQATTAAAREVFLGYAKAAGLDPAAFAACQGDPAVEALVAADLKEADGMWVRATPTFFIRGKRFVGSGQLRTLGLNRIEDLLKKKS